MMYFIYTASSNEFGPDFSDHLTIDTSEYQKEETFHESSTNEVAIELLNLLTPAD